MYKDTTIITPTLNEAKNIGKLLEKTTTMYPGINVIVSDDGSRDDTQIIVKEFSSKNGNISLLDRSGKKRGLTASVMDGVLLSKSAFKNARKY